MNRDTRTFKSHNQHTDEDQPNPGAENQVFEIEASSWEGEKKTLMGQDLGAKCGEHELLAHSYLVIQQEISWLLLHYQVAPNLLEIGYTGPLCLALKVTGEQRTH